MPSSLLPVIDLIEQDPVTGQTAYVPNIAVHFYQFTQEPATDSIISPDPGLSSDASGVLHGASLAVVIDTSIRARATFQGMANFVEVRTR